MLRNTMLNNQYFSTLVHVQIRENKYNGNMSVATQNSRKVIPDRVVSLLKAEICNVCPLCGKFEGDTDRFENHHINHDPTISEYWNLIRICKECHKKSDENKNDGRRDRRLMQIKRSLFRQLIGSAGYDLLSMAKKYKVTSALYGIAEPLRVLGYIGFVRENAMKVGGAGHPTICDCALTPEGEDLVEKLKISIANR